MSVAGFARRVAGLPVRTAQAGGRLAGKLLRLAVLAGVASALVLILDVLLLGKRDGGETL